MSEKCLCVYSIHGVCNSIRKISTMETFVKYFKIHALMKIAMAVITIYAEEIKTAVLFKKNNGGLDYLFAHMEAVV